MTLETFPTLTTDRLILRQLLNNDFQNIFELRSNLENNKFIDRKQCKTNDEAKKFINLINENLEKGDTFYWAISLFDSKQFVGTICLYNFSSVNNSCEIGYELMMKFQKQGIMQEALEEVINFAFQKLKLMKIIAFSHFENKNSTNLLLKFNFLKSEESVKNNPNLTIFTLKK